MDIEYFHWKLEDILPLFPFVMGIAFRGELHDHRMYLRQRDDVGWTFEIEKKSTGRVVFSCNHTHTCPPDCG